MIPLSSPLPIDPPPPSGPAEDARIPEAPRPEAIEGPDFRWPLHDGPRVWGVINLSPDSFHPGSRFDGAPEALGAALGMEEAGAAAVDLGAESTRPGSRALSVEEEWTRLAPVLGALTRRLHIPVSVDTWKAEIARRAAREGARILNSVGALRWDPALAETALELDLPIVLMHALDRPRRMQRDPRYRDVVGQVADFLRGEAARLLAGGMPRSRVLIDPGLGFGKTLDHNRALIRGLGALRRLGFPILVGASRKSFIGRIDGSGDPRDRLGGSLAVALEAARRGASVLRVHDVAETVQALRVARALEEEA